MKVSEKWLRSWVDPDVSRDELIEQLTNGGLEVEECKPAVSGFENIVVGHIREVIDHPEDSHLSICIVDDGENEHRVVCGAPNAKPGLNSAFARINAELPSGRIIKKVEIKGYPSDGMLCSEAELDLGLNAAGILELDSTLRSGELIRDVLDLDDYVVDIDLTPNRGDCFSICGVAREVGVYNRQRVRRPEIAAVQIKGTRELSIHIEDEAGCPRYLGRIIQGIDITRPTPLWMLNRLRGCGLRSINAVVDTTNYVMLELGQPMHAFDLAHVEKGIGVRKARAGESLMLLDGSFIDLDTQTLLITSDDQPVAMAGVMGGIDSGIQDSTSDIFLECAFFAPEAIMGTARRYGLHTNASIRYERGVDYNIQFQALDRLTELLVEIVGGTVCPTTVAETTFLPESSSVEISENRLRALIGEVIPKSTVTEIFELLDFGTLETDGGWRVDVPSHRFDIALEEDLVEEVCRVYGYNSIESRLPDAKPMIEKDTNFTYESRSAKNKLKELGYAEVMTYSFVDPELQHAVKRGLNQLMLQNPMATDRSAMRASLLPGLLESLKYNLSRQQETVRLFEVGLCFHQIDDKNVSQENRTAGIAIGTRWPTSWPIRTKTLIFTTLKAILRLCLDLGNRD